MIETAYAIVEPYQRPAITACSTAYVRLADFRAVWA